MSMTKLYKESSKWVYYLDLGMEYFLTDSFKTGEFSAFDNLLDVVLMSAAKIWRDQSIVMSCNSNR